MLPEKNQILLVDDEPLVLEMFEELLSIEGYKVVTASTAFDAMNRLRSESFDMLICDVRLEPFDGFEIMEKAQEGNPELPVILITGAPIDGDRERLQGRNTVYLVKPVQLPVMRDIVRELFRSDGSDDSTTDKADGSKDIKFVC